MDLISSKFPSSSEHLSLCAASSLTPNQAPNNFFPPQLEFLLLQPPVLLTQMDTWPPYSCPSLSGTLKAPSLLREQNRIFGDIKATPQGNKSRTWQR